MQNEQEARERVKSQVAAELRQERLSPQQDAYVSEILACLERMGAQRLRYS